MWHRSWGLFALFVASVLAAAQAVSAAPAVASNPAAPTARMAGRCTLAPGEGAAPLPMLAGRDAGTVAAPSGASAPPHAPTASVISVEATPAGPTACTAHDLRWHDAQRHRDVPVRLYWPASLPPDAQVPLVVFSHGLGGSAQGYTYLGSYWASQGVAALYVQHVGSDRQLWRGNPLTLVQRLHQAAQESEAIARAQDVRFALDELARGPWWPRIDAAQIVAAGHSYGANTALLLAGARVERDGQAVSLRDPRIRAAIALSAPPFYGERDLSGVLGAVRVPTLHITTTEDVIRIPGYYSGVQDRLAVFSATGSTDKLLAVFAGGAHNIFSDRSGTGGLAMTPTVKEATQALTWAFLEQVWGRPQAARDLADWRERYAPLLACWSVAGDAPRTAP